MMKTGLIAGAMVHAASLIGLRGADHPAQPPAEVDRTLGKTRAERRNRARQLRSKKHRRAL